MMCEFTTYYHSPIGWIRISGTMNSIVSATYSETGSEHKDDLPPIMSEYIREMDEYFKGERKIFNINLKQEGTVFQKLVWENLISIPFGTTISYLDLAIKTGNVKNIRAVGNANGKNNIPIIVPCHRVIGSNGKLIGYAGGLWRKQWLLEHEARICNKILPLFAEI